MGLDRTQPVAVVGAGLVGSLLSIFLRERGFEVTTYERSEDIRNAGSGSGRSINLVMTSRGIRALERVGLRPEAMRLTVPVTGRMLHGMRGELTFQPYGRDESECNYSISRRELNQFLIDRAEERGVEFRFDHALDGADLERGRLRFGDREVEAATVFGTDGAVSGVRAAMKGRAGFDESMELLEYGYKELLIPRDRGARIELNALHIWPRGRVMLMALPNLDGSFTVTLYLPYEGPSGFAELDDEAEVLSFFERQFPDAVALIPDLTREFFENPTGNLGTVRCLPWHVGGKAALVGDAAHAIVPFFGQGMNCGFEDCTELGRLIDADEHDDWGTLFAAYQSARKGNADAIADMALENFVEMRDRVGDAGFLLRKQVEHRLEVEMPQRFRSRYSMVMYSHIPYRAARDAGRIEDEILDELCRSIDSAEALDLDAARALIERKLTPFLDANGINLNY
ncbi:MAG: FAD-dependent monooxygenase [bacterium]|nr:FAD-dependent monooxygenase [bacterium]